MAVHQRLFSQYSPLSMARSSSSPITGIPSSFAFVRKLRRLAMSIAFYNLGDVWNNATAGMVERSHAQVAADAIDRWKRAQRVYAILDD